MANQEQGGLVGSYLLHSSLAGHSFAALFY